MSNLNTFRLITAFFTMLFMLLFEAPAYASSTGSASSAPSFNNPGVDITDIYRQGIDEYSAGDFKAAERSMKRVTAVARKDANSHYVLGLSQIGLEKWKSAGNSLKKAIRYDEELYDARAQLGMVYIQRDKPENAAEELEELQKMVIACADSCPEKLQQAFDKLTTIMANQGDSNVGLLPGNVDFSKATGEFAYLDAVRLINLGRYQEAIAQLQDAHMVYGPHPDVLTYLGFAYRMAGNSTRAVDFYRAALELAPDHLNANEYLGEYYVEQGDFPAARIQLAKLEKLCNFGCAQIDELSQWIAAAES